MKLPDAFLELLRKASPCFITTLMPDGSPQTTETWVDTDGEHVIINTVKTHLKVKNIERDPRVSVAVCDAANGIAPFPVELRVVSAARWDSYATFFSDATGAASGRRAATREGMWT